jgi:hypothetical protein
MTDTDVHPFFQLAADIKIALGGINDTLKQQARVQAQAKHVVQPVFYRKAKTGTASASGLAVLGMSRPDQGHAWIVRSLAVGGNTPTTAITGRADIFISGGGYQSFTSTSQLSLSDWVDQAEELPLVAFYSNGQMICRGSESIWVVFSGVTAGQQCVAVITVEDYEEGAMQQAWSI